MPKKKIKKVIKTQNKPITSFNIWLGRNILYNKKRLIKQQNDVRIYIEKNNLDSKQISIMGKKQFIKQLHLKCQLPIGPLYLLFDNIPNDNSNENYYNSNEIIEFICNYLYQLRFNNPP